MQRITSTKFGHVKLAHALHKKNARDQEGLFIIEGLKELLLAVDNGVRLHSIFKNEEYDLDCPATLRLNSAQGEKDNVLMLSVTDRVFQSMSYRSNSGLIAIAHKHDIPLEEFDVPQQMLLVICSGLEKPGNLGAVVRSADAAGAHAVVIADPILDVFNPNVVRASIGTLFTIPVICAEYATLLPWLRQHEITVIATSPVSDTSYTDCTYPDRIAIVIGNETQGLQKQWFQTAHQIVSIPQFGQADSLNAAMSATLVMYEVLRQRTNVP